MKKDCKILIYTGRVEVMGLNDKVRELVNTVKGTPEYHALKQARSAIDGNKTLRAEMEMFSRKQSELYSGRISKSDADAVVGELQKKFGDLSKIPEVDRYLKSLKQFNEMMSKVYKGISDLIEADMKLN